MLFEKTERQKNIVKRIIMLTSVIKMKMAYYAEECTIEEKIAKRVHIIFPDIPPHIFMKNSSASTDFF